MVAEIKIDVTAMTTLSEAIVEAGKNMKPVIQDIMERQAALSRFHRPRPFLSKAVKEALYEYTYSGKSFGVDPGGSRDETVVYFDEAQHIDQAMIDQLYRPSRFPGLELTNCRCVIGKPGDVDAPSGGMYEKEITEGLSPGDVKPEQMVPVTKEAKVDVKKLKDRNPAFRNLANNDPKSEFRYGAAAWMASMED